MLGIDLKKYTFEQITVKLLEFVGNYRAHLLLDSNLEPSSFRKHLEEVGDFSSARKSFMSLIDFYFDELNSRGASSNIEKISLDGLNIIIKRLKRS